MWIIQPLRYWKPVWTRSWATCSGWSCFGQGLDQVISQGAFLPQLIPDSEWLCASASERATGSARAAVSACCLSPDYHFVPACWVNLKPALGMRALPEHHEFTFPTSVSKGINMICASGQIWSCIWIWRKKEISLVFPVLFQNCERCLKTSGKAL